MKKSLILGAAALATIALAPAAQAAEVTLGGCRIISPIAEDSTLIDNNALDDRALWASRLQLNLDAKISDKTSVHYTWRPVGNTWDVQGMAAANADNDSVMRLWAETEFYGVGVKAGDMPLSVNDGLLLKDTGGSYGTILLSKSFGDMTVVGMNIRVENQSTSALADSDDDQTDVYGLSLLGKAGNINYQVTWAHAEVDAGSTVGTTGTTTGAADDDWFAVTAGTEMSGIKLVGTVIWETGVDMATATTTNALGQLDDSGVMAALKLSGKSGFGSYKGYAFYAGEDYTHPHSAGGQGMDSRPSWSTAWDAGVGSRGLFETWAGSSETVATNNQASQDENMWGLGGTLAVKAGAWTISPALDYASIVESNTATTLSAVGGSLTASTTLDEGTTLSFFAIGLDPQDDNGGTTAENMHTVGAQLRVNF